MADGGVNVLSVRRGHGDRDSAEGRRDASVVGERPSPAGVCGFVNAVGRATEDESRSHINGAGSGGVDHHVGIGDARADRGRGVGPRRAAVGCLINPHRAAGESVAADVAHRGVGDVGVRGVDGDLRCCQAVESPAARLERPGRAAVDRLEDADAGISIARVVRLARPGVEHQRVALRDGDGTHGEGLLAVGQRCPVHAGVRRLPDAAASRGHVIQVRVGRARRDADNPAGRDAGARDLAVIDRGGAKFGPGRDVEGKIRRQEDSLLELGIVGQNENRPDPSDVPGNLNPAGP